MQETGGDQQILRAQSELTVNNNAQMHTLHQALIPRRQIGTGPCLTPSAAACRLLATRAATTFADYVRLQQLSVASASNANAPAGFSGEATDRTRGQQSIYNRPQLHTFAEYQTLSQAKAERRARLAASMDSSVDPERQTTVFQLGVSAPDPVLDSESAMLAAEGEEDSESCETKRPGCCSCCCSRGRRGQQEHYSRRKRRPVGTQGASDGAPNVVRDSISIDEDAELGDVKDMDPTITLMPYVLFESERAKVLYQSVSIEEADILKRAINLHANDTYKKVLMRLHMFRYLHQFRDAVVRSVLSRRVTLGSDSAQAAAALGIDLSEDTKSSGASSSAALSVGLTIDQQPAGTLSPSPQARTAGQTAESSSISRSMLKRASAKFTDVEMLQLLNGGKIIDVTGRASLESLVSLPTTKMGLRRGTGAPGDKWAA